MSQLLCQDCNYSSCGRGCLYFQNQLEIASKEVATLSSLFIDNFGLIQEVRKLREALSKIDKMDAPTFAEAFAKCVDIAREANKL